MSSVAEEADGRATPFRVHVPQDDLDDLVRRLGDIRVPQPGQKRFQVPGPLASEPTYGVHDESLSELLRYWRDEFDWREQEARLNAFPQFTMLVQGLRVHFIHQRSANPDAIPLVLVHGWPGSVWEFLKMLPLLEDSFHVVCPHIPGYGWSEGSDVPGMDALKAGDMFAELMHSLGYDEYLAQGGDWGALVTKAMALRHPRSCVAWHTNLPLGMPGQEVSLRSAVTALTLVGSFIAPNLFLDDDEQHRQDQFKSYMKADSGYFLLQATRPHTLGWALDNSPVALCAWIFEKVHSWTDTRDAHIFSVPTKDEILGNISTYWFTRTGASSVRFYHETAGVSGPQPLRCFKELGRYVGVPTAVASFPQEIISSPRAAMELSCNVVQYTTFHKGGHFAAWECHEELASDIIKFATKSIDFKALVAKAKNDAQYGKAGPTLAKILRIGAPVLGGSGAILALLFLVIKALRKRLL